MIASLLAQESMEMIKNTRDNNLAAGRVWDSTISICATQNCDFEPFLEYLDSECGAGLGCPLFLSNEGYSNGGTGDPTLFYRYFRLAPHGPDDYTATVVVSWYHGTVLNEVRLASELTSGVK